MTANAGFGRPAEDGSNRGAFVCVRVASRIVSCIATKSAGVRVTLAVRSSTTTELGRCESTVRGLVQVFGMCVTRRPGKEDQEQQQGRAPGRHTD